MLWFIILALYMIFNFFKAKIDMDCGWGNGRVALDVFLGVFVAIFELIRKKK